MPSPSDDAPTKRRVVFSMFRPLQNPNAHAAPSASRRVSASQNEQLMLPMPQERYAPVDSGNAVEGSVASTIAGKIVRRTAAPGLVAKSRCLFPDHSYCGAQQLRRQGGDYCEQHTEDDRENDF